MFIDMGGGFEGTRDPVAPLTPQDAAVNVPVCRLTGDIKEGRPTVVVVLADADVIIQLLAGTGWEPATCALGDSTTSPY